MYFHVKVPLVVRLVMSMPIHSPEPCIASISQGVELSIRFCFVLLLDERISCVMIDSVNAISPYLGCA
jgi:hypothetical protein